MKLRLVLLLSLLAMVAISATGAFGQSGTWNMAGVLLLPANNSVTLNDGRVLVVGSRSPGSSQMWSPATQRWTPVSSAPITFFPFTYVPIVLNDGRVLVTGWCQAGCVGRANAEIYNPVTNTWVIPLSQMAVSRYQHAVSKLADGRILITGGCNALACASATTAAEIFDPRLVRFTTVAPMLMARADHTSTLLSNGKVLVTGGGYPGTENESYDPATNRWSVNAPMNASRLVHTATLLANGKVLVTGGIGDYGVPLRDAEVFNPATGAWSVVPSMAYLRAYHQAVRLPSGKVLVVAGQSIIGRQWTVLATAEMFDPVTNQFLSTGSMANARTSFGLSLLLDGRPLAVGGDDYVLSDGRRYPGDAELYQP
jgi:galactose oxidase-like protein